MNAVYNDHHGLFSSISVLRCRLCWTIAGAVFAGILAIEGAILIPSYQMFQQAQRAQVERVGLETLRHLFLLSNEQTALDGLLRQGSVLVRDGRVVGATLYDRHGVMLGRFDKTTQSRTVPPLNVAQPLPSTQAQPSACPTHCMRVRWTSTQLHAPFEVEADLDIGHLQRESAAYVRRIVGLVILIAAFVTIVTMVVLARLVLFPILLLGHHMVQAGADLDAPRRHLIPARFHARLRHDELERLFHTFNVMLERLAAGMESLRRTNDRLEEEVAERTAALRATNRKLEKKIEEHARTEEQVCSLARFPDENTSPILRLGLDGTIIYANAASTPFLEAWGSIVGQYPSSEWVELVADVLASRTDKEVEVPLGERIFSVRMVPLADAGYINLYGMDITDRKEYENQWRHLSTHDALTGLPNLSLFQDRWQRAVERAVQHHTMSAILLLGAEGVNAIEQVAGRAEGNRVRKEIARRLEACLPQTGTLARLGGNLFAIVLSDLTQVSEAADRAHQAVAALAASFALDNDTMEIQAAVGISMCPGDGTNPERLIHLADLAMARAMADSQHGQYRFYEVGMNEAVQERRALLRDLRLALEHDTLTLHYQPQISLADNRLVGMEALLRWHHPDRGMVSPARFIPLAEENRLMVPIGLWVLRTACRQAKRWQEMGLPPFKMAVNLSPVQFRVPDLVASVEAALCDSGLEPACLDLEITESVAVEGLDSVLATLAALRHLGVSISIDDFGTGYSSLSYLQQFPVQKVKIDQSFVRHLEKSDEGVALCHAIVKLGHSLRLTVIAEGVETAQQLALIRGMGCDQVQGYHFSRPLDGDAFVQFVQTWPGER